MTVTPEQIDLFVETYGRTRHQGHAGAAAGVSAAWVADRKKKDPVFRQRLADAAYRLDGEVLERTMGVILKGAPREVINMASGDVITLRQYCPKTTLAYLSQYCGWGEAPESIDFDDVKQVELVDGGQPVRLLDVIRASVEQQRGVRLLAEPQEHEVERINGSRED